MDTDQSNIGVPQGSLDTTPDESEAFACREEGCGLSAELPFYFETAEQYTVHWNTFHVGVPPAINCLVRGRGVKIPASPNSIDAFFHHVTKMHPEQGDNGRWPLLNNWVWKGLVLATQVFLRA